MITAEESILIECKCSSVGQGRLAQLTVLIAGQNSGLLAMSGLADLLLHYNFHF